MPSTRVSRLQAEFGDFQTPRSLADQVGQILLRLGASPVSILEPTCGTGTLLAAAIECFPEAKRALGIEINPEYVEQARRQIEHAATEPTVDVVEGDFFATDWADTVAGLRDPILVIGNPPWVTNSVLGTLHSNNLPAKSNTAGRSGLEALTGKSNFDISEWMIRHLLQQLDGRDAVVAMLCKTSVARKVLKSCWEAEVPLRHTSIHRIDSMAAFSASVDACLLICWLRPRGSSGAGVSSCAVCDSMQDETVQRRWGYHNGSLIADMDAYRRNQGLLGESPYRWRSGVKHDCAAVMELSECEGGLRNGLGDMVQLEETYLYPLLKSSEIARGGSPTPVRKLLMTQRGVSDDPTEIEQHASATWLYLERHAQRLDRRGSSVYRKRPRFSIFGVGSYSFAPWKVAISGFYKSLGFCRIAPHGGRPIMLDDTAYFLPCQTADEMDYLQQLLLSQPAQEFLSSFIFWDAKRPVTAEILGRLNLAALARSTGSQRVFQRFAAANPWVSTQ